MPAAKRDLRSSIHSPCHTRPQPAQGGATRSLLVQLLRAFRLPLHQELGPIPGFPLTRVFRLFVFLGLMCLARPHRTSGGFFSGYFTHTLTDRERPVAFSVATSPSECPRFLGPFGSLEARVELSFYA